MLQCRSPVLGQGDQRLHCGWHGQDRPIDCGAEVDDKTRARPFMELDLRVRPKAFWLAYQMLSGLRTNSAR
jgi:hypothetical protein